jgi:cytochrome c-type biogenesis protein CcmH
MKRLLLTLFTLLALLVPLGSARAQSPEFDDDVREVAKKLNCPTCAGRNLADCPTETCLQWKSEIRAQLDSGRSSGEVLQYFQSRFGTTVLQEPPKAGNTLALWLVPVGAALMLFGGGLLVMRHIARRGPVATAASAAAPNADPYIAELERQVKDSA